MTPYRESLPAWQRRLLASGNVALDVAHTGGVGDWIDTDLVVDARSLAYWLGILLERQVVAGPGLEDFRELRKAMFRCGQKHLSGSHFARHDVEVLNRLATGPCVPTTMSTSGTPVLPIVKVDQALAHIAREGIALLTGPHRARIRECAAEDCRLLFVDTSRPGHRRWCSMARCGNISKTRHYRQSNDR